jgi:exodeoxyribonuclease-3
MRIATFNINNVVRRLPNLLAWLADSGPDVVCLQELKATDAAFPAAELEAAGYGAVIAGQRTWNGVAILARGATPIVTRYELPGDPADTQARYIEAAVRGVLVASIYAPNGNPNPGPKFGYKLAWLARLAAHAGELMAAGAPVALAGDYNVVPTEADIYQPNSWAGDALVDPAARQAFAALLAQGWTDSLLALSSPAPQSAGEGDRRAQPGGGGGARRATDAGGKAAPAPSAGANNAPWTFWSYLRRRWENDHGLRIDHILLSPALAPRLQAAGVDKPVRGEPGASDHAPTWIDLAD